MKEGHAVMLVAGLSFSLLLLWLAACHFGQPFLALFVAACGALGFVAGYVARGEGR